MVIVSVARDATGRVDPHSTLLEHTGTTAAGATTAAAPGDPYSGAVPARALPPLPGLWETTLPVRVVPLLHLSSQQYGNGSDSASVCGVGDGGKLEAV